MIELKNVSKEIFVNGNQKITILHNINLKIESGEFIAIIGKSGSGKSTLLHIMSGLMLCTEGNILIDGSDIANYKENELCKFRNQKFGFVFQSFYLEPSLTALDNVSLPLIVQGIGRSERIYRAKEALRKVGLAERADYKPAQLSGGEQQRVSIARAIINNPQIIFADEPTGNLDVENSQVVMEILEKLSQKGTTIVMVTHDLDEAKKSQRVIALSDGKICGDK